MSRHTAPSSESKLKVSNPVPDMLFGYDHDNAFTEPQQAHYTTMGNSMVANSENLTNPFFVVECKGEDGRLYVATNQCLGGAASCVNAAEQLNCELSKCGSDKV